MPSTTTSPLVFALSAEPGRESEDAIAIGDGVAVVVDGAGLPKELRKGCRHSVAWFARNLAEAFRDRLEDFRAEMTHALAEAITWVTDLHSTSCDLSSGSPSATVAAWRINGAHLDYLVLCDASVVLVGADGSTSEVTDDRIDDAVERGVGELLAGRTVDSAEESRERFAALERMRNSPDGFWCCHTDPAAASQSLVGRVLLSELAGIVVASDGGTRGFRSFGAHSLDQFAKLAIGGDLERISSDIRAAERSAPDDLKVKRHDDIALVAVRIASGELPAEIERS